MAHHLDDLKEQAAALKMEATVYAFGIGSEINTNELEVFFVHMDLSKYSRRGSCKLILSRNF